MSGPQRIYDDALINKLAKLLQVRGDPEIPMDYMDKIMLMVDISDLLNASSPKKFTSVDAPQSAIAAANTWANNQKQVLAVGTTIWALEIGSNLIPPGYLSLDLLQVNLSLSAAGMAAILMVVETDDTVAGGLAVRNTTTGALHPDAQSLILSSNPVDPDAFAEGAATTYGTNTRRLRRYGVPPGPTAFTTPGDLVASITPARTVTPTRLVVVAHNLLAGIGAGTIGMEIVIRLR